MGEKRKKVYAALVDGATEGLTDTELYNFVLNHRPGTSSKKIIRASLGVLKDSRVRDRNVMQAVLALAINERMRRFDGQPPARDASAEGQKRNSMKVKNKTKADTPTESSGTSEPTVASGD
ncbi:hypothetical protein J2Y48_004759 [Mycoplana sp. BE70]|uniref:hypothetical protein n=1 Tax=Mycoplana sp. BE70 TaxID=2817775 RepID=UPI00285925E8|nr:hypothetical protein [Mycoplana sp. BE70]MDR6759443.1 hypothetical protein [Mycoplana sp. BE70]